MTETNKECQLCGSAGPHPIINVREMYFGTRDTFDYFSCVTCETLQIVDILQGEQLMRYYPRDYYSYNVATQPAIFRWLTAQQDRFELRIGGRVVGGSIALLPPGIRSFIGTRDASGDVVRMLGRLKVDRDARILDVGGGGGALLDRLATVGFKNISGADPFIEEDGETRLGVPLKKQYLSEVTGEFDLIMFNHSLEHVPDPVATLKAAHERLTAGGACLVRLPTTSSEAWTMYKQDWVMIDAPKHIVIPSREGMSFAANRVGFRVEKWFDDSNSSQFFGSELYRRDIAAIELKSIKDLIQIFGFKRIWAWEKRAQVLNRQGRGDQTGFVLRPK